MTDLDPEKALLGICLDRPKSVADVDLDPRDFAAPVHEALWRVMVRLHEAGEPGDAVAVLAAVSAARSNEPSLHRIDAPALHALVQDAPLAARAGYYAGLVASAATRRRLHAAGVRIQQLADTAEDVPEAVEQARAEVDTTYRAVAEVGLVSERIDATLDALERPSRATATPWVPLNDLLRGWRPGALYVIGARPGVGKSILAINAATSLAEHGYVSFASLEMPEPELHHRILASIAEVPLGRLSEGTSLTQADWERIMRHRDDEILKRIAIDDRGYMTTTDIRSHARTLSRKGALSAVIVDYLQLMSTPAGDRRPRHEIVAGYSRALKLLAKELDVPVIALSQLNRNSAGGVDKRPQLSDLRESGAVEQDADVVILLSESENDETAITAHVAKNRHGSRGEFDLVRRGWYSRFDDGQWTPSHAA